VSGDGVSLQTNLVQLGNVAKTTARSAQVPHGAAPGGEAAERREVPRLHRVNEVEKTEHQHVDPDRRRERDRRESAPDEPLGGAGSETAEPTAASPDDAVGAPGVGVLVDRKA